jgi:hypothetical protein
VSSVITDTGISDKAVQLLEQYGVKVVTVEPDGIRSRHQLQLFQPAVRPAVRSPVPDGDIALKIKKLLLAVAAVGALATLAACSDKKLEQAGPKDAHRDGREKPRQRLLRRRPHRRRRSGQGRSAASK